MNKEETYRQCTLSRSFGPMTRGREIQVSWIPAKYAVEGDTLRLKEDGVWIDGWVVESVGDAVLRASELPDGHSGRRAHRKNTGDAMGKG